MIKNYFFLISDWSRDMLAYFVVIIGGIGLGLWKILSQSSGNELPLGFDDRPKPGMRILNKLKEWVRKITRDKVCNSNKKFIFIFLIHFRIQEIYSSFWCLTYHLPLLNFFTGFGRILSVSFLTLFICFLTAQENG